MSNASIPSTSLHLCHPSKPQPIPYFLEPHAPPPKSPETPPRVDRQSCSSSQPKQRGSSCDARLDWFRVVRLVHRGELESNRSACPGRYCDNPCRLQC